MVNVGEIYSEVQSCMARLQPRHENVQDINFTCDLDLKGRDLVSNVTHHLYVMNMFA